MSLRFLQLSLLATIPFLLVACSDPQLPTCTDKEVESTVGQIINDMPLVQLFGASFVSLKNQSEQGFNKDAQLRSCTATLVTTAGEDNLQYSIKWQDRKAGTFYVEARILE